MLQDVYEKEGPLFFQDFSQYTHKDRQKMNAFDRCGSIYHVSQLHRLAMHCIFFVLSHWVLHPPCWCAGNGSCCYLFRISLQRRT